MAGTPTRIFGYDAAGNTTTTTTTETGAAQTLTWDKENHLATVATGGSSDAGSYIYDSSGARIAAGATDAGGVTRTALYLPDGIELEKSTGGNLLGQRHIGVAVRTGATGLKWTISNHQGTHTGQIDPAGPSISQRRSMPYGETRGAQPTWIGTKGYVGRDQRHPRQVRLEYKFDEAKMGLTQSRLTADFRSYLARQQHHPINIALFA